MNDTTIPMEDGKSSFIRTFQFPDPLLLASCVDAVSSKLLHNPPIVVYGKPGVQHRDVGFFSATKTHYKYSGQLMPSQQPCPFLAALLAEMNQLFGTSFNGILVNRYNDGHDYIGAHSDDEFIDPVAGVVSLSFGAERIFRIRDKKTKAILRDTWLSSGLVFQMGGPHFQTNFTHEIPKQTKLSGVRYSFTFRTHQ